MFLWPCSAPEEYYHIYCTIFCNIKEAVVAPGASKAANATATRRCWLVLRPVCCGKDDSSGPLRLRVSLFAGGAGPSLGLDIRFSDHAPPLGEIGLDLVDRLRGVQEFRIATGGIELLPEGLVLARLCERL